MGTNCEMIIFSNICELYIYILNKKFIFIKYDNSMQIR